MRLRQDPIDRARRILGTRTETETVEQALELVIFRKEVSEGIRRIAGSRSMSDIYADEPSVQLTEAVELIRSAVGERQPATWADFGAGKGTFTEALASLLGPGATIIAVDRDPGALAALRRLAADHAAGGAAIRVAEGDFVEVDRIPELQGLRLDGALFANALHYVADPATVLGRVAGSMRPGGRIVVIEYERSTANPWVPYPLPSTRLAAVAEQLGLRAPTVTARRPSLYHREMYCAVLVV